MPHYNNSTWTFARGATATIDRDLGFLDTHLFHDIIGTHVCHHLVSTIPFYHAGEASAHIRRVMGAHYKADAATPFWRAFWRNQRACKFVEESAGMEGTGVFMYRNPYAAAGAAGAAKREKVKASSGVGMSSGRNLDARRRLSQSAQLRANLPLLAEG
jgi:omega-6 fatty acid desaturase (delta-12 desaturase)